MGCSLASNSIKKESLFKKQTKLTEEDIEKIRKQVISQSKIEKNYEIISKIKESKEVKYYQVNDIKTKKSLLLRVYKKTSKFSPSSVYLKLEKLKSLSHSNIIKLHSIYEDQLNIYIITDNPYSHTNQVDFLEGMKKYCSRFTEKVIGSIFNQIINVLTYLHTKNVCHGNIRPESFIIQFTSNNNLIHNENNDENGKINVILIDYGELTNMSNCFYDELKQTEKYYKPYFTAPELLKKLDFSNKVDVFSAGVMLFLILSGKIPFEGNENNKIKQSICDSNWTFQSKEWEDISSDAKDLIVNMLCMDTSRRYTSRDSHNHKWMVNTREGKEYNENPSKDMKNREVYNKLSDFQNLSQLQIATMDYISNYISNKKNMKELKGHFTDFDKNGDGVLSYEEFKLGYSSLYGTALQSIEMNEILSIIDKDKSGKIEYDEFIKGMNRKVNQIIDENLKEAFTKFDSDCSGRLSVNELISLVGYDYDYIVELLKKYDKDNDGELSFSEFKKLILIMANDLETCFNSGNSIKEKGKEGKEGNDVVFNNRNSILDQEKNTKGGSPVKTKTGVGNKDKENHKEDKENKERRRKGSTTKK